MDFAPMISAINTEAPKVVLAIMAVAALKLLPGVTRWGASLVVSWFR